MSEQGKTFNEAAEHYAALRERKGDKMARKEYEMTEAQLAKLLEACRPVPYIIVGGIPPRSPPGEGERRVASPRARARVRLGHRADDLGQGGSAILHRRGGNSMTMDQKPLRSPGRMGMTRPERGG